VAPVIDRTDRVYLSLQISKLVTANNACLPYVASQFLLVAVPCRGFSNGSVGSLRIASARCRAHQLGYHMLARPGHAA
jgi:hypothetical protein